MLLAAAVSRIWRYGQTQPCFLYHLIYAGTVEEHLYARTLAKLELFARVRAQAGAAGNAVRRTSNSRQHMGNLECVSVPARRVLSSSPWSECRLTAAR